MRAHRVLMLAATLAAAGCPCQPLAPATPCQQTTDCPASMRCDVARHYCASVADEDSGRVDAAVRDAGEVDRGSGIDHARDSGATDAAATGDAAPPADASNNLDAAVAYDASPVDAAAGVDASSVDAGLVSQRWILVSARTAAMGSPTTEVGRWDQGGEVAHQVTLTHDFYLLATELTQGAFLDVMGYNPSAFDSCGLDCPVENVTWHEAAAYCNTWSEQQGLASCYDCSGSGSAVVCDLATTWVSPYLCPGLRLPTEAEWELAARAGTTTATYNGDLDVDHLGCESPNVVLDPIAWTCSSGNSTLYPVGLLRANALGFFDLLGNNFEWCHDWWGVVDDTLDVDPWGPAAYDTEEARLTRGGSALQGARWARAAFRNRRSPTSQYSDLGFRPARTSPD